MQEAFAPVLFVVCGLSIAGAFLAIGEPIIDVDLELARLTTPEIDADLRAEIRDLVIARNHRRARAGKAPLDVEAEVEREIASLSTL